MLVLIFVTLVLGYRFTVPAGEKEVFFEKLEKGEKFGINFQVEEGGNYDIDFYVNCV